MDAFMELNCNAKSPYITEKENQKIIETIVSKLPAVTKITIEGEDGEQESDIKEFLDVLENYKFQENEARKILKSENNITLNYDSDYVITAYFE